MKGLTEGRIVHYVLANGGHRPAIVVRDWDKGRDGPGGCNLQVFLDGTNDMPIDGGIIPGPEECGRGVAWRTSVGYSARPKPGTWHWPERTASDEAERQGSEDSQGD